VPIVASIDLQLQFAIIAHSKDIEVAFSQTDEGRRRSKIATLWEPVRDGRLPLQAIPVLVVILGVIFAELAYDVDAGSLLDGRLEVQSRIYRPCSPNQPSKRSPSICGRGSNSFPQPIGRVDMVPRSGPTDTDFLLGTSVVADLALGVAHGYDSLCGHPTFFPFLILGILVRIAESNHLHTAVTRQCAEKSASNHTI